MNKKLKTAERSAGDRFQTNEAFLELFGPAPGRRQWRGALVRPCAAAPGTWHVRVDGIGAEQVIHEKFMETER